MQIAGGCLYRHLRLLHFFKKYLTWSPLLYTDFGKNITLGKNVFINAGCKFQDQGGIFIDDGALIGHGVVIATLNQSRESMEVPYENTLFW